MNLLQKLSLMKENVEDWRELVESIMIDWDYDGETLRPKVTDIPGKKELVKGVYPLPKKYEKIQINIDSMLHSDYRLSLLTLVRSYCTDPYDRDTLGERCNPQAD